jgi:hypothetical protein
MLQYSYTQRRHLASSRERMRTLTQQDKTEEKKEIKKLR